MNSSRRLQKINHKHMVISIQKARHLYVGPSPKCFFAPFLYIFCIGLNAPLLSGPSSQYAQYIAPLSNWYKAKSGKILNLNNPITFDEKIQWLKIYDSTPMKTFLTDKYLVKQWVKEKIGEQYVVPLLGVWDNFDAIDFSTLPKQFVLKVNSGSKWNIFVRDKDLLNWSDVRQKITKWMKKNYAYDSYEMHYKNIKHKIIAEEFIHGNGHNDEELCEYSVFCFNGNPYFILTNKVVQGCNTERHNVYDLQWNFQPFTVGFQNSDNCEEKPLFLEELIRLSTILCQGFKFVRVDFFHAHNQLYFGEMTFTPRSGLSKVTPEEYSRILGDLIDLDSVDLSTC